MNQPTLAEMRLQGGKERFPVFAKVDLVAGHEEHVAEIRPGGNRTHHFRRRLGWAVLRYRLEKVPIEAQRLVHAQLRREACGFGVRLHRRLEFALAYEGACGRAMVFR